MTRSPEKLAIAAAFGVLCLIWSSTWLVIKIGLEDLPPISYVAIRFVIAILLLIGASVGRVRLTPRHPRDFALLAFTGALLFGVNYCLLFWAELHVSSGLAAVLQATIPIFGIILAHWLLPAEPLRWQRLAGALVALGGVALICARLLDLRGPMAFWGGMAILLGSLAAALSNTLMKRIRISLAPSMIAAWQMIFAVLPLVAIGAVLEGNPLAFPWTARAVLCVLYLAVVGSAIAFWLFYWLLDRMAATNLQTISLIIPPVALLIGWGAGGESFSGGSLIGTGLVLVGVWTVFRKVA
jgi:drug/metabolite transporter (DMT)-like permease